MRLQIALGSARYPVGKFLWALSLDELPQLFNVVAGTMSLVGPRPIVEAEIERYGYGASFAAYCSCRPGITGLWQVHGRSNVDYSRRVELDRRYADQWSFVMARFGDPAEGGDSHHQTPRRLLSLHQSEHGNKPAPHQNTGHNDKSDATVELDGEAGTLAPRQAPECGIARLAKGIRL